MLILSWVGIGYLIDWVLFDLPSDNEIQTKIDQNRMATKCEEMKTPSFETSESENTSDGNNSNEDEVGSDGNSDFNDSSDVKMECISSNNSSKPASSETKKDD